MTKSHLFLDFDQTLFNHFALADWMDDFFVKQYHVKPGAFIDTFDEHHEHFPDGSRLYHNMTHVKQITGRSWSHVSGEIERQVRIHKLDFCYTEVHNVVATLFETHNDLRILTFGNGDYQRFKINSCPYLRVFHLGIHVVSEPKAVFLEREFPTQGGVLVDDKYPLNLPKHWQHVWINRSEPLIKPEVIERGVVQISDLSQVRAALELI